jgi:hypothetical protein
MTGTDQAKQADEPKVRSAVVEERGPVPQGQRLGDGKDGRPAHGHESHKVHRPAERRRIQIRRAQLGGDGVSRGWRACATTLVAYYNLLQLQWEVGERRARHVKVCVVLVAGACNQSGNERHVLGIRTHRFLGGALPAALRNSVADGTSTIWQLHV